MKAYHCKLSKNHWRRVIR